MSNELKEVIDDIEKDAPDLGDDPTDEDTTDWKAEALKARGIAKRNATRLEKLKKAAETKVETIAPPVKKEEKKQFDYAEKSFLKASGIEKDEYDFVLETMQSTGKDLDSLLENKFFQAELKERRLEKDTKEAIPVGTKRSTAPARDSVEYWVAKINAGEATSLDIPDVETRNKVLDARIKQEQRGTMFTSNPIV